MPRFPTNTLVRFRHCAETFAVLCEPEPGKLTISAGHGKTLFEVPVHLLQLAEERGVMAYKPILCLDFDGVVHSYTSGWKGADVVPDPPVDGAMRFIWDACEHFRVAIYSSRSGQSGGIHAMRNWLEGHFRAHWAADRTTCDDKLAEIEWPQEKPAALVTIDDRAITFTGTWPDVVELLSFKPWNKR